MDWTQTRLDYLEDVKPLEWINIAAPVRDAMKALVERNTVI